MAKIFVVISLFIVSIFANGIAHLKFGDTDVYIISVATRTAPADKLIAHDKSSAQLISQVHLPPNEHNVMLLKNTKFMALVDTGFSDTTDELAAQMSKFSVKFDDITHIILTHGHFDHLGGVLSASGKRNFKNATLLIDKIEYDFWLASSDERAKKALKSFERVKFIAHDEPLFDAQAQILAIKAYGHTLGHIAVQVADGARELLFWADVVHAYGVQMRDPQVAIKYDVDPAQAVKTRLELFERLKNSGKETLVIGVHMPFVQPVKFDLIR